jgi:hypothetical protein
MQHGMHRPPSAGQQLAQFLKEQLAEREEDAMRAHRQAAALQQQLLANANELAAMEGQCRALARRAEEAESALQQAHAQLAATDRDRAAMGQELQASRGGLGG